MLSSRLLAPPNSMVLLLDPGCIEIPSQWSGQGIIATQHCVMIGCRCELDGATEFLLGDLAEMHESTAAVFEGLVNTPSKRVNLVSALNEVILEAPVSSTQTRVHIWCNDSREPDRIAIGIKPCE